MTKFNVKEMVAEMVHVLDPENAAEILEDALFANQVEILQTAFDNNSQPQIEYHSKKIGEMIAEFPDRIKIKF